MRAASEGLAQERASLAAECWDLRLRIVPALGTWGRDADWYQILGSIGQGDHCESAKGIIVNGVGENGSGI